MPTPDQVGSPFRAAKSLSLDHGYGGKITAYDQLPIHALGDRYLVEGSGTVTSLPALPPGEQVELQMAGTPTFTNSAKLICPGGVNYVAAVDDMVIARSKGDGIWRLYVLSTAGPTVVRGHISGLTLSTAGSSATFGIAAGVAADSTNAAMMALASAYTKTTSAWAVGSGNGSFDGTGSAPSATAGWCHVHLIQRPDTGAVDVLTSLSATAPTLPTNYTLSRRIGSMKTNSSAQWVAFTQYGDNFIWQSPVLELSTTTPATTLTALSLAGVAPGVSTVALLRGAANSTTTAPDVLIASGDETLGLDGVTGNRSVQALVANVANAFQCLVVTNASNQIKYQAAAGFTWNLFAIVTFGYIDRRGRDA